MMIRLIIQNLVDSCWGAGCLNERGQFTFNFEPGYFLPPPEQFIYTHLPTEPIWQLLGHGRVVSVEEFTGYPHVYPHFFSYGMETVSHKNYVIEASV